MTPKELFRIWAPEHAVWSPWAKPVMFAQMRPILYPDSPGDWQSMERDWVPPVSANTLIVVDLPGRESVTMGFALAERGYQPVPLYNACDGPGAVVSVEGIMAALRQAAPRLLRLNIPADAPPAFLLDSGRMSGGLFPKPGSYDNRSVVFPQDFPSANFLLSRGMRTALLLQRGTHQPKEDLSHVLLRWQEAGINIQVNDPYDAPPPVPLRVTEPSRFRSLWYRASVLVGLRRNSAGGFGGIVPMPSSSSGFG
jgi:hypothetical protein